MSPLLFAVLALLASAHSVTSTCTAEKVKTYTTTDASILSAIAYIVEFNLKCSGTATNANYYAEVGGRHLNVVRSSNGSFQVSWTEDVAKATRGDHLVNVYDEESFPQVRKGKGELPKPLVTLTVNHPGAYSGPWLSSEVLAAIIGAFVVYIALSCRSKLLA